MKNLLMDIGKGLLNLFDVSKILKEKLDSAKPGTKRAVAAIIVICLVCVAGVWLWYSCLYPTITSVTISEQSLTMQVGDTASLGATVLYSNNTQGEEVFWSSSNEEVATVDAQGLVTGREEGSAVITAQASNRKGVEQDVCQVQVVNGPSGYTIQVERTSLDNYVYITVQPLDGDVTDVRLYATSPSGKEYTPDLDANDLYHFHEEAGLWTVYASVSNQNGTYEAQKPEDYVEILITDISPGPADALAAGLLGGEDFISGLF